MIICIVNIFILNLTLSKIVIFIEKNSKDNNTIFISMLCLLPNIILFIINMILLNYVMVIFVEQSTIFINLI